MSDNKMLIDATHPEETRVVVLRQGRVEEFDYESAARKQLRGNIYLAKVTRVEPALQAAFIDYGGNRHGFLAFNEIHPDYYQIPVADRIALLEEEAAAEAAEEAAADARAEALERRAAQRRVQAGEGGAGPTAGEDEDEDEIYGESEESENRPGEPISAGDYDDEAGTHASVHGSQYEAGGDVEAEAGVTEVEPAFDEDQIETIGGNGTDDDGNGSAPVKPRGRGRGRGGPSSLAQNMPRDPSISEGADEAEAAVNQGSADADAHAPVSVAAGEASEPMAEDGAGRGGHGQVEHQTPEAAGPDDERAPAVMSDPDDHQPHGHGDEAEHDHGPDADMAGTDELSHAEAGADARPESRPPSGRRSRRRGGRNERGERGERSARSDRGDGTEAAGGEAVALEQVGNEDALEELPARSRRSRRSYKIQEVIKRRQVMLIQVVKEERGNKGAALTTYLSLAGRYTVLMPNTARGGGISRKITNPQDRKRLKAIAQELDVPEGMGLIIRTAGAARTKQEIRRDFEYLLRLWESVRELTLRSTAPSLVYEEGDLIKRSIRDLYNKDIDEVIVAGEAAYQEARSFMRMLMPSHAKNVIDYKEPEPLFTRFQIERQLNAMFSPYVNLKSGGYLVINQTEALVAVDVNSGRSTREYSIEETALHTNLEASDEIARQLKLRDLAGLVVIDFIDMEEKRNNRHVERRLKDALRFDRARIQVGRISPFGLMEMSRQRLRTGVLEGSTSQCPHCQGTGIIRSVESVALAVLRGLEDAVMGKMRGSLIASTTAEVALYILNNKREFIVDMEARHGYPIVVQANPKLAGANFTIEKGTAPPQAVKRTERTAIKMDWAFDEDSAEADATATDANGEEEDAAPAHAHDVEDLDSESDGEFEAEGEARDEDGGRRRRRRRRRGGRRSGSDRPVGEDAGVEAAMGQRDARDEDTADDSAEDGADEDGADEDRDEDEAGERRAAGEGEEDGRPARRRRRGRRGGRRNRERTGREGDEALAGADTDGVPGLGPQPMIGMGQDDDDEAAGIDESRPDTTVPLDLAISPDMPVGQAGGEAARPARPEAFAVDLHRQPAPIETDPMDVEPMAARAKVEIPGSELPTTTGGESQKDEADQKAAQQGRSQPVSSEPRLERVKVGPGAAEIAASANQASVGDDKTSRRGWWQRKLLGG